MNAISSKFLIQALLFFSVEFCFALLDAPLALRLIVGIVTIRLIWKACVQNFYFAHPISIYIIMSAFYVFAALSEVALFGNRLNLDPQLMGDLADMGVAFLLFAGVGFLLFGKSNAKEIKVVRVDRLTVVVALASSSILYLACLVEMVNNYGILIGSVSRADLYAEEVASLTLMRGLLAVWLGLVAAALVAHESTIGSKSVILRQWLYVLLFAYVMTDLLILGDRRLPLVAILGVLAVVYRKSPSVRVLLSGLALATVFIIYGYVRNTPPENWPSIIFSNQIFLTISPVSTEFGGMAIIGGAIVDFDSLLLNFPPYSDALLQVIPRSFLVNRPMSPTEWFINSYYPELAATGASYAFNQVIEARINLGLMGIAAIGCLTGTLLSLISRITISGIAFGVPVAIHIFSVSMRMDFASILRTSLMTFLGLAVLTSIMMLARINKSGQSQ